MSVWGRGPLWTKDDQPCSVSALPFLAVLKPLEACEFSLQRRGLSAHGWRILENREGRRTQARPYEAPRRGFGDASAWLLLMCTQRHGARQVCLRSGGGTVSASLSAVCQGASREGKGQGDI